MQVCLPRARTSRRFPLEEGGVVTVPDFLEGAVDLHVHSAPDIDERRYDDFELAREACRAGMSALLIKSHQFSTVERAWLVSQALKDIAVFGGIVMNHTVGGFNPAAVEAALRLGAKQVWMPTRSARNHRRAHGQEGGLAALDEERRLRPEILRILEMMAGTDCLLGTGHLSAEEAYVVIEQAREFGIRVLVTHPEWSVTFYPIELQKKLAAFGNVWFERCFVSTTHRCGHTPMSVIEDAIVEVGVSTTVIATDLGQPDTPPPAAGFRQYADRLRSSGFSVEDIRVMMRDNPGYLLGIRRGE
jgi:hypothetical protein